MEETNDKMIDLEELQKVAGGRAKDDLELKDYYELCEWKNKKVEELVAAGQNDKAEKLRRDFSGAVYSWHTKICDSENGSALFFVSDMFKDAHPEYF